ncbi:MAG: hypothetical protein JO319_08605 [Acidobacteriaceae bacterium]|nr:hypothetical protein [Acidobacteriaceae bacterium]
MPDYLDPDYAEKLLIEALSASDYGDEDEAPGSVPEPAPKLPDGSRGNAAEPANFSWRKSLFALAQTSRNALDCGHPQ